MSNKFDYGAIPNWAMESMKKYVEEGRPMGDFLEAIFANDLVETFSRADYKNTHLIYLYVRWMYNHAPITSRGSRDAVQDWIKNKKIAREVT